MTQEEYCEGCRYYELCKVMVELPKNRRNHMSRPKKENARRKQFRIRMTEDEHHKLAAIADHMQMDMSDAIRELLEREWVDICFELMAESEGV